MIVHGWANLLWRFCSWMQNTNSCHETSVWHTFSCEFLDWGNWWDKMALINCRPSLPLPAEIGKLVLILLRSWKLMNFPPHHLLSQTKFSSTPFVKASLWWRGFLGWTALPLCKRQCQLTVAAQNVQRYSANIRVYKYKSYKYKSFQEFYKWQQWCCRLCKSHIFSNMTFLDKANFTGLLKMIYNILMQNGT